MKARHWVLIGFGALLLVLCASATWLITTESGARTSVRIATRILGGKLSVAEVGGRLSGPLTLNGLHYRDLDSGVDAAVDEITLDANLSELLARRAHVLLVAAKGLRIDLTEPLKKEDDGKPFSLKPPLDVILNSLTLDQLVVNRNAQPLVEIKHAEAAGAWTSGGLAIQKLLVDAAQGHVSLKGQVSSDSALGKQDSYRGEANGSFDWLLSDQTIAGTLTARSDARELRASIAMSSPVRAQIDAKVGQNKDVPWSLHLDVPVFDPNRSLVKGSSVSALEARLDANGDLKAAEVRGDLGINGEHVVIDPLRAAWNAPTLTISELKVKRAGAAGELNVNGTVAFDTKPFLADIQARWTAIELPAAWVGQKLVTRGDVRARGNSETFAVKGALQLGPPGRLADLAIDVSGTPEEIEIREASIVQKSGRLAAQGAVKLKPAINWQLSAEARTFDPGAFVAGWPGRLGFKLDTKGRIVDEKPIGTLTLTNLSGTLRNRNIAGQANLSFDRGPVVAGNLDLKSGKSSIHVTGEHGQTLNAIARIDIASLDDWIPGSRGRIGGTVHAEGNWPKLAVNADLSAANLQYSGTSIGAATVVATLQDPKQPSGTLRTQLTDVNAQGFHFGTIALEADGGQESHTAHLKADGDPISAEFRLQGAQQGRAWTGSVTQLVLADKNVASLALQQPMQLRVADPELSVSESCMAGDGISICFGAERNAKGESKADYKIEHLPLSLIVSLAAPTLPFKVSGLLEGHGDARQMADGSLFGNVVLTSDDGEIREAGDPGQSLLKYQAFQLNAELAGSTATGSTQAQLGTDGKLEGRVSLAGLSSPAPTIDASGKITIADLTPISLFVAQLANVHGSGEGAVTAVGPLKAPQITGQGRVVNFAAEVPKIGLKLHDGEFTGALRESNAFDLNGHIASGTGTLAVSGASGAGDSLKLKISGKNFLAADIPGARVVVTPDLDFARGADRMDLTGTVTIPEAAIDITKLPQGQQQRAPSPDVVVIDDKSAAEAKSTPLFANVRVVLGESGKVKLVGFGLDATLTGELGVQEIPGQDPIGSGEIRVAGTYKAYGQNLTIQEGRLLYANQVLANPQVILTAVRVMSTGSPVTAKLTVTGTAQRPQLDVSADPAMSQTQALSYLVTGKPVEQLGSGEGNAVQTAARSVGGAAGNLLAKNIGKRLGIDTIGVDQSDEIGGSAFTIGQYLSPRLYVSYGVGLFEPGQVITLKYKLSDRVSVEAAQGPLSQRAGINYRVER